MRRLLSLLLALWLAGPAFAQVVGGENLSNQAREVVLLAGVPHLPGATVDLNFAAGQYYTKGATGPLTVSRASSKTCSDLSGNWKTVAANVACITNQGVLIEESRTNSVRNSTMVGAVVGNPGTSPTNWVLYPNGLSTQIVATGTLSNGINYVDIRLYGTSTGPYPAIGFDSALAIVSSYGQTWTNRFFAAWVATPNIANLASTAIGMESLTSGGGYISSPLNQPITITSNLTLFSGSATITDVANGASLPTLQLNLTGNVTFDATLRIGWPQLELNPNIPATVASAVTTASGTGGVNGTAVYTVTGGTCTTQPTLNTTWAAGVLTVNSVANAGSCSVLPPSPATLAYASGTATGWTGATVTLTPTNNSAQGFATSPILTSGSAATRAADNVSIGLAPGTVSLLASGTPLSPTGNLTPQIVANLHNSGATNEIALGRYGSGLPGVAFFGNSSSGNYIQSYGATWTQNVFGKLSQFTVGTTAYAAFNNSSFSAAQANGLPGPMPILNIGSSYNGFNYWNGYISRVAVSPSSLLPY